ncbi:DUF6001 family protein [Rhizobium leguminosarum]|uniref:DUF6001 family protein n=1 Tax=Rhizobium leguminosarum TaxID=384 RepID=UPI003ECFDAC5
MRISSIDRTEQRELQLVANLRSFLSSRALDVSAIIGQASNLYPGSSYQLFTSSPVQGLATSTSDVDIILLLPGGQPDGMATQFYLNGAHCEVVALGIEDIEHALSMIGALAASSVIENFGAIDNWNSLTKVSRKYLERVVNGVSSDATVPFARSLAPLASVWAAQALQRLIDDIIALQLSIAANEVRAPVAYALAAVSNAMDVMLCARGFVYSNKKWILSRWRNDGRLALEGTVVEKMHRQLGDLHGKLRSRLGHSIDVEIYMQVMQILPSLAALLFGQAHVGGLDNIVLRADLKTMDLGKGSAVALTGEQFIFPSLDLPYSATRSLQDLASTEASEARGLLALMRANLLVTQLIT